ncbi:MAG: sigma-70 family RNA polymerase sigma factor [Kofleriaceae bacterium]
MAVVLARVPHADAADVAHDVFEQALRKLDELAEPAAFAGWLMAIARNRATDHARRARRAPIDATTDLDEVEPPTVADALPGHRLDTQRALAAIRTLPVAYQETLLMRLAYGLTGPQIAARTGLTEGSVRVNLHRGMQRLREIMRVDVDRKEPA